MLAARPPDAAAPDEDHIRSKASVPSASPVPRASPRVTVEELESCSTYVVDASGGSGCFKDVESAWSKAEAEGAGQICLVIRGQITVKDTIKLNCSDKEIFIFGQGRAVLQLRSFPWFLLSVQGSHANVTLRDLKLDGGIQFTGRNSHFTVDACDVGVPDTCTLYGIWTSSALDCANSNLTVSRSVVHGFAHGVSFGAPGGSVRVENSEIHGCQQGIRVGGYDAFSAEIVGCQIHDCTQGGVVFYKPVTARVFGCALWDAPVQFYGTSWPPQPSEAFVSLAGNVIGEKGAGRPAFVPPLAAGPPPERPAERSYSCSAPEGGCGDLVQEARRAREEAEAGRAEAERGREEAEAARVEAERGRRCAEAARAEADERRAAAERGRAAAERARSEAEVRAEAAEQRAAAAEHRAVQEQRRREEAQKRAEEAERGRADAAQAAEAARGELREAEARAARAEERAGRAEAEAAGLLGRLEQTLRLDEAHLRSLPAAELDALRPRLLEAIERVAELRATARALSFDCVVCLDSKPREQRRALQPCGHSLCLECAETLHAQQRPCPSRCNNGAPIAGILRVFE
eukprot:tig00021348_g20543.t1